MPSVTPGVITYSMLIPQFPKKAQMNKSAENRYNKVLLSYQQNILHPVQMQSMLFALSFWVKSKIRRKTEEIIKRNHFK